MNCKPIGVYWPTKENGSATIMGRKLFEYENSDYWFIDPDTFRSDRKRSYHMLGKEVEEME